MAEDNGEVQSTSKRKEGMQSLAHRVEGPKVGNLGDIVSSHKGGSSNRRSGVLMFRRLMQVEGGMKNMASSGAKSRREATV